MSKSKLINKEQVFQELMRVLEAKYKMLVDSALEARDAATNSESKAENKYDTRGLEASYLAGAQAERAAKLKEGLTYLTQLKMTPVNKVAPTALVQIRDDEDHVKWLFFLPLLGGETVALGSATVLTITPEAPLGKALQGREVGDEITTKIKGEQRDYEILSIQ